jgi:hypothetical protein
MIQSSISGTLVQPAKIRRRGGERKRKIMKAVYACCAIKNLFNTKGPKHGVQDEHWAFDGLGPDEDPPTPDSEEALQLYKNLIEPALLSSLHSDHSTEQIHALAELGKSMFTLPASIAFAFIKDKQKWALLEKFVRNQTCGQHSPNRVRNI